MCLCGESRKAEIVGYKPIFVCIASYLNEYRGAGISSAEGRSYVRVLKPVRLYVYMSSVCVWSGCTHLAYYTFRLAFFLPSYILVQMRMANILLLSPMHMYCV